MRAVLWIAALSLAGCAVEGATTEDLEELDEVEGAQEAVRASCAAVLCVEGTMCINGHCKPIRQQCNDPDRDYISRKTSECQVIRFLCADGLQPFSDNCGCGCEPVQGEACGPTTCTNGTVCCNPSCGICTEPGSVCTQQICTSF